VPGQAPMHSLGRAVRVGHAVMPVALTAIGALTGRSMPGHRHTGHFRPFIGMADDPFSVSRLRPSGIHCGQPLNTPRNVLVDRVH
jgi:hypothetical protein